VISTDDAAAPQPKREGVRTAAVFDARSQDKFKGAVDKADKAEKAATAMEDNDPLIAPFQ